MSFGLVRLPAILTLLVAAVGQPAWAEDETQACDPDGQALAYGDVLAGCTIEAPADFDIFTFAGATGDRVSLIVTETGGSGVTAACLEIRDSDNGVIAGPSCADTSLRLDVGPLPRSGIYQGIVTEAANAHAIPYNLSLERTSPLRAPTPLPFPATGDVLIGREILPVADLDTFSFYVNVGDEMRLVVAETSGNGDTAICAEILGPDDGPVVPLVCNDTAVDLTLPPSPIAGTHQLIATEAGNDRPIVYNVGLNCLSGTCTAQQTACIVAPRYAGNSLTLDLAVRSPGAEWHVAILALGQVFTLWRVPLQAMEFHGGYTLPDPVPALGTIAALSTLTTSDGLVCAELRTVDTGTPLAAPTADQLKHSFGIR